MSVSPLVVRPVRETDDIDLQANCFSRNTLAQVQEQIKENLAATAHGLHFQLVAEVAGIVVGNAELERETHHLLQHRAEWCGVVVDELYQRRGIARALLQQTLAQAASWGIELLTVGVRGGTAAEQVYHRLGFQEYSCLPGGFKEVHDGELLIFDDVRLYLPVPAAASPSLETRA